MAKLDVPIVQVHASLATRQGVAEMRGELDDDAADWLDAQGARLLVRRAAPGVYVLTRRGGR